MSEGAPCVSPRHTGDRALTTCAIAEKPPEIKRFFTQDLRALLILPSLEWSVRRNNFTAHLCQHLAPRSQDVEFPRHRPCFLAYRVSPRHNHVFNARISTSNSSRAFGGVNYAGLIFPFQPFGEIGDKDMIAYHGRENHPGVNIHPSPCITVHVSTREYSVRTVAGGLFLKSSIILVRYSAGRRLSRPLPTPMRLTCFLWGDGL